jgi:hypothetical protein
MKHISDATLTRKLDEIISELCAPCVLANAFADMSDYEQAAFLVEIARLMRSWDVRDGLYMQSLRIGQKLKMNADVREMLMTILASAEET